MGHGAYGVVCSAFDHARRSKVAIKKVPDAFADKGACLHTLREMRLLQHFHHDNVNINFINQHYFKHKLEKFYKNDVDVHVNVEDQPPHNEAERRTASFTNQNTTCLTRWRYLPSGKVECPFMVEL